MAVVSDAGSPVSWGGGTGGGGVCRVGGVIKKPLGSILHHKPGYSTCLKQSISNTIVQEFIYYLGITSFGV